MASRSWPLSAKHRLREYDSCCLRGMGGGRGGGDARMGAGLLVGHMVLTLHQQYVCKRQHQAWHTGRRHPQMCSK